MPKGNRGSLLVAPVLAAGRRRVGQSGEIVCVIMGLRDASVRSLEIFLEADCVG